MKKYELKEKTKVLAICNTGEWKKGKIKDNLSHQYFIQFKDKTTTFISKKDSQSCIKVINNESKRGKNRFSIKSRSH